MEPFILEELKFSESNSKDHILVSANDPGDRPNNFNLLVAFAHKDEVLSLRNWLNEWLDKNVFDLNPRA